MAPTVQVIVEDGQGTFNIHEDLLRKSSPFFSMALTGPCKESTQAVVEMPKEEAKIFNVYMHWLYSGKIPMGPAFKEEAISF